MTFTRRAKWVHGRAVFLKELLDELRDLDFSGFQHQEGLDTLNSLIFYLNIAMHNGFDEVQLSKDELMVVCMDVQDVLDSIAIYKEWNK